MNLVFYGITTASALYITQSPDLEFRLHAKSVISIQEGSRAPVYNAYYVERSIPLAAALTFAVNLFVGAGATLSLPSLLLPFAGLLMFVYRSLIWGLIVGPAAMVHFGVLGTRLLEGHGYILAALGICIQGSWLVRPTRFGYASVKQAFIAGIRLSARMYVLIPVVLLVAAVFETTAGVAFYKPVFTHQSASPTLARAGDQAVHFVGSGVYYDSSSSTEADARVVGVLLQGIGFFRPDDTTAARFSRNGATCEVELVLQASFWEDEQIRSRLAWVCSELNRSYPTRKHQVVAISVDSVGCATPRVFRSQRLRIRNDSACQSAANWTAVGCQVGANWLASGCHLAAWWMPVGCHYAATSLPPGSQSPATAVSYFPLS